MNYAGAEGLEFGGGNTAIDPQVLKALPSGCRVVSTEGHGLSFWANTGRIDVELEDGTPKTFFIKVISNETGKNMVHGEFESMLAITKVLPDFAPKPIAWGTYETIPDTHFFLCEYREMVDEMPDPNKFSARLAALHQESKSPNGKFGFHVTTYSGNLDQVTEWEDSWQTFFTKSLKRALKLELPSPALGNIVTLCDLDEATMLCVCTARVPRSVSWQFCRVTRRKNFIFVSVDEDCAHAEFGRRWRGQASPFEGELHEALVVARRNGFSRLFVVGHDGVFNDAMKLTMDREGWSRKLSASTDQIRFCGVRFCYPCNCWRRRFAKGCDGGVTPPTSTSLIMGVYADDAF